MSYYGILTKRTDDKIVELTESVEDKLKTLNPVVEKFLDSVRDKLWHDIESWMIGDCGSNVRGVIADECEEIIEAFLMGDIETIEKTKIISEYNFRKLPEVRLAIFNACADDLQKAIVDNLVAENKRLEEDLKCLRESRNY